MVEKFEAGKKYKRKGYVGTFTCLDTYKFRDNNLAGVLRYDGRRGPSDHGDMPHIYAWSGEWEEYIEPKIEKFVKNIIRYENETPITCGEGLCGGYDKLGKIEITLTDGKLTSVEIVKE